MTPVLYIAHARMFPCNILEGEPSTMDIPPNKDELILINNDCNQYGSYII